MRERVLIVEDNKALAKLIAKKMNAHVDMDIVVTHSYAEAIEAIEENDDFFIALLDINLPDFSLNPPSKRIIFIILIIHYFHFISKLTNIRRL